MSLLRKATPGHRNDLMVPASPGSQSRACTRRIPQEPGRPRSLHAKRPAADRYPNSAQARRVPRTCMVSGRSVVPLTEGNEATREGYRGVGASRSTEETGEPEPQGPGGGKGELEMWTRNRDR